MRKPRYSHFIGIVDSLWGVANPPGWEWVPVCEFERRLCTDNIQVFLAKSTTQAQSANSPIHKLIFEYLNLQRIGVSRGDKVTVLVSKGLLVVRRYESTDLPLTEENSHQLWACYYQKHVIQGTDQFGKRYYLLPHS